MKKSVLPKIKDDIDLCVYFCFMLDSFGTLSDSVISEIVRSVDSVNYFELVSMIEFMKEKSLISESFDQKIKERVYTLKKGGKELSDEFYMHIPSSVREKTLETGKNVLKRLDMERAIRCYISNYDGVKKRYDLTVRFLNELNGETILELKLFAPNEKKAQEMMNRFLSKPSFIITRIMNMFLKDDYFMYDK